MKHKTKALYDYLITNTSAITDTWMELRCKRTGSHYSLDASPEIAQRIRNQNNNYVKVIAQSLLQTDEEMRKSVVEWTNQTAVDRANSETALSDVSEQLRIFRRVYWQHIELCVETGSVEVTVKDVFQWEKKINNTFDFIFENFTSVYMNVLMKRLISQQAVIRELSAPIIPLSDEVGVLPLIGDIDSIRAKCILDSTLSQSIDLKLTSLIVDLSGVPVMDTMVANQIFMVIDSLRLVGITAILTGIRPEVAKTAVHLGIDFKDIQTYGSLKQAINTLKTKNTL
ncbi:STAS domain-containing protein [Paenisporosarcina sp. TG-14]|uniref:STAS domain-containing protein n=1 Tax=Paenisporosarcina sp. TG-14 TaxID=1231057 RepID=UPI000304119F|nr:STAS domain-containing protein [Paenisporosarcina sp. TG-14]